MNTQNFISLIFYAVMCGCRSYPSDAELLKAFQKRRPALDNVVALVKSNKQLAECAAASSNGSSEQRKLEELLKNANVKLICGEQKHGEILFSAYDGGPSALNLTLKGYAYLNEQPRVMAQNLDSWHPGSNADSDQAFRHIEGNWYVFAFAR